MSAAIVNNGATLKVVEETLHSGMETGTIFPAPCGLGSTWDPLLIEQIGTELFPL
jgi:beta-glucosidase-like glycosyl hydrolase